MRIRTLLPVFAACSTTAAVAEATEYDVSSSADILSALQGAVAGDVVRVAPGTYTFDDKIRLDKQGTAQAPIVLRGNGDFGAIVFETPGPEGVFIPGTDYRVENVWLRCTGSGCPDAAGFSFKASARRITISHCRTTDFYQHYKGSLEGGVGAEDVTIENSEAFNTPDFAGATNAINLDGGVRWRVVGNYVHDYGNQGINYGIFFKGGTKESVIEKNIVACSHDRASTGEAVLGISFGGGRMGVQYCAADNVGQGGCRCEDFGGIARNNIVVGCNDSALHVNSACGSKFLHNVVDSPSTTLQIQSFEGTGAIEVKNNVLSGDVPSSNVDAADNLVGVSMGDLAGYYAAPGDLDFAGGAQAEALRGGAALADVPDDFCGTARPATPSRGPVEMPSACSTWPWSGNATPGTTTSASTGAGAATGAGSGAGPGSGATGSAASGGSASTSGGGGGDPTTTDDGGCSVGSSRSLGRSGAPLAALALALLALGRRRSHSAARG